MAFLLLLDPGFGIRVGKKSRSLIRKTDYNVRYWLLVVIMLSICLHAHQEGVRPTGPTDTLSQDQKPAKRTKSLKKVRTSKGHWL